ncbi:DUF4835 family protein [Marinilongibacter aquaticus]|uniref:type IX secretion system protein PorD n=1 Tax=Marinilongibacter aquaticus TaxID=2975157 RepID=UPI0021BD38D5|nr:DUF4835 family protein [Marinilongibacter aquaticus]UBM58915.1 DUF4835 family protein [Marinilongibacter aquaticus]
MKLIYRCLFLVVLVCAMGPTAAAQELNARVEVNYQNMKTKLQYDPKIFQEIQNKIQDFMNTTQWTNDRFAQDEKIKCDLIINIMSSPSQNVFNGNAQFQTIRPIYGTDYESVSFKFTDLSFSFSFQPIERQMIFNERSFSSNITSLAAYYSLLALTIDYDTFSSLGGSPYLQRLYSLVTIASSQGGGWSQDDKSQRNRYWLIENIQNQQFIRLREELYKYHRLVLDDFGRDPKKGREEVMKFLQVVQNIATLRQSSVFINALFDAKSQELINVFSDGSPEEKQKAFSILTTLDPDKTEQYRRIIRS